VHSLALAAAMLGFFFVTLDAVVVNVALPTSTYRIPHIRLQPL
jgi:hypothetical protein